MISDLAKFRSHQRRGFRVSCTRLAGHLMATAVLTRRARSAEVCAVHVDALYTVVTRLVYLLTFIDISGAAGRGSVIMLPPILAEASVCGLRLKTGKRYGSRITHWYTHNYLAVINIIAPS